LEKVLLERRVVDLELVLVPGLVGEDEPQIGAQSGRALGVDEDAVPVDLVVGRSLYAGRAIELLEEQPSDGGGRCTQAGIPATERCFAIAETERSPGHRAKPEAPDQRSEGIRNI
jgi:hypothetical protein